MGTTQRQELLLLPRRKYRRSGRHLPVWRPSAQGQSAPAASKSGAAMKLSGNFNVR